MSEQLRNVDSDEREIRHQRFSDGQLPPSYPGFEGMNYEQLRQPYDPKHQDRNCLTPNRTINRPEGN